jgi:hypothetical protein
MSISSTGLGEAQPPRRTCSIIEAGKALGLGKNGAYAAADRGEIKTLKFGERRVVPLAWLEDALAG